MKNELKLIIAVLTTAILVIIGFIFIYYTIHMSLSLNGEAKMEIGLCGVYEEPGAEALLNGKDASDKIKISGEVDTSVPGEYEITYTAGTLKMSRSVHVLDKMNPVIDLKNADSNEELQLGEKYKEPGYTAYDENGKDITDKVSVKGDKINRAGINYIEYTVEDDYGNMTRVKRKVNVLPNTDYDTPGVSICMYHYVYDENDPPADLHQRFGNYISMQALEEELNWLNEEGYYYPTWEELREYVDGRLLLPEKSIILCFDDGAKSFLKCGIPVLEKCEVPATCFMITKNDGKKKIREYQSEYVCYESHSHNMHRGGGNIGHGGIFTAISYEEGMADLKKSIDICGSADAFAYPYGDYNDASKQMVEDSGFMCAVTTQPGKAYPGDDPMLLPRVRMSLGQSLASFKAKVQP